MRASEEQIRTAEEIDRLREEARLRTLREINRERRALSVAEKKKIKKQKPLRPGMGHAVGRMPQNIPVPIHPAFRTPFGLRSNIPVPEVIPPPPSDLPPPPMIRLPYVAREQEEIAIIPRAPPSNVPLPPRIGPPPPRRVPPPSSRVPPPSRRVPEVLSRRSILKTSRSTKYPPKRVSYGENPPIIKIPMARRSREPEELESMEEYERRVLGPVEFKGRRIPEELAEYSKKKYKGTRDLRRVRKPENFDSESYIDRLHKAARKGQAGRMLGIGIRRAARYYGIPLSYRVFPDAAPGTADAKKRKAFSNLAVLNAVNRVDPNWGRLLPPEFFKEYERALEEKRVKNQGAYQKASEKFYRSEVRNPQQRTLAQKGARTLTKYNALVKQYRERDGLTLAEARDAASQDFKARREGRV